ncbi:MAG TPA: short-chain dehydrogenase, partial [Gammaproteobacteria bacterium]|nr:short-chain dehydrogenase [Gammaproteobacteria bacterium]
KADDHFMKPDAIANSVFALTQQDRSAWTFELDLRPFGERW